MFVMRDEDNATARYRATWPCERIRRAGHTALLVTYRDLRKHAADLDAGKYDVLVTNSMTHAEAEMAEAMIGAFKDLGLRFVYDLDDDVVSDESVARMRRLLGDTEPWETLRDNRLLFLAAADLVTVSRPLIGQLVRPHTRAPIRLVENAIDATAFGLALAGGPRRLTVPPVIGWAGARRESDDLESVAAAWRIVAEREPDVRFAIQGLAADNPLAAAVPSERLYGFPWVPLRQYGGHLRNIDIACCSIADTTFGRCKSPIKWFEMALAGIPCVVSETVYGEYVRDGVDALVARDPEGWADALLALLRGETLWRRVRIAARARVLAEHELSRRWTDWWDAWCAALDDETKAA